MPIFTLKIAVGLRYRQDIVSTRYHLLALGLNSSTVDIVLAICLDGLTHEQAAARFGCTRVNITRRVMYARRRVYLSPLNRGRGRPKSYFRPMSQVLSNY